MAMFMFWKKKRKPAESAAQHLANLMRTSVAGFVPEPPNDNVDLDTELFVRNNISIAALVIITGLVRGGQDQKTLILESIEPGDLNPKSFESYLFGVIAEASRNQGVVSVASIEKQIPEYGQVVYGKIAGKQSLEGDFYKWSQILRFEPTEAHIVKAIELCHNRSKRKGLVDQT